jgi:hypothetical protein
MATAATATTRRAAPPKKVLERRRIAARERLDLEIKLRPDHATVAKLDAELKKIATDQGDSFKEDFGELGYVSASGAVAAEFKGDVPVIVTEVYLALKPAERKALEKRGIVVITPQYGKASNGRVTPRVL